MRKRTSIAHLWRQLPLCNALYGCLPGCCRVQTSVGRAPILGEIIEASGWREIRGANVGWNRSFALSIVRGVEPKVAAFGKKWETQPFKSYPNAKASCSGEHLDLDTVLYSCMSVLYRTVQYEC